MNEKQIKKRIKQIKEEILTIEEIRPGSITRQKRKGKGEYFHLSYTHMNKGYTEYIRPEFVQMTKQQIENYKTNGDTPRISHKHFCWVAIEGIKS